MGNARIGALRVDLGLNSAAFENGLTLAERRLADMGRNLQKTGRKLQSFGQNMTVAVTAPLAALAYTSAQAAIESREAMAQVEAGLKSMGDASGRTLPQLEAQAKALQKLSTFDDDDILRKVTANMLTFGNVSGDAFDRAQLAAVDLSSRMKTDLQSSTILIGKALNDPIKGLSALSRVGIQFTEDQKAMIGAMVEAGNVAGAQGIILTELERQYAGSGKAARDAAPGSDQIDKWRKVQERIGELVLVMGERLLPVVDKLLSLFLSMSPEAQTLAVGFAAVAAALGPVLIGVGSFVSLVATIGPPLVAFASGLTGIGLASGVAATGATAFGVAVSAAIWPITAIAAAAAAAYLVWKNWDTIEPILKNLYTAVRTWVVDKLNAIWDGVKKRIEAVKGYFYDLYDAVVGHSFIPDMVDGIAAQMARLDKVMVQPAATATERSAQAFEEMAGRVQGILDRLFPAARAKLDFGKDSDALAEMAKRGEISAEQYAEALRRLRLEHAQTMTQIERSDPDTIEVLPIDPDAIPRIFDETHKLPGETKTEFARPMELVFADMAANISRSMEDVEQSIMGFVQSIKKGDIIGIIGGIANVIGSISNIVSGFKTGFKPPDLAGARAMGGPVNRASSYLVGERGPEIFTPDRAGKIIPNHELGRGGTKGMRVEVVKGDLFDVIVGEISSSVVANAAPGIAAQGAAAAVKRIARMQDRGL